MCAVALLAAGGCFDRSYPAGLPCGPDSLCPPGQSCDSENVCRLGGGDAGDPVDAESGPDTGPDACPTRTIVLNPDQDGMFVSTAGVTPDAKYGGFPIANIGVGIRSMGVFRFDLTALDAGVEVVAGELEIFHNRQADDCGGTCGSCSGIDKDGLLTLHYLRSDWDEGTYDAFQPWQESDAAAIGVDRSPPIATTNYIAPTSATFDFALEEYPTWRADNRLSFLVVPTDGAVIVSTTKEPTGCAVADSLPTLTLTHCTD